MVDYKKYPPSIVQDMSKKECFICGSKYHLEAHHIFGGAMRKKSTQYGLVVWLCHNCHNEPPNGVHFNREKMDWLRKIGQEAFERKYPNKDFLAEFHRNYK